MAQKVTGFIKHRNSFGHTEQDKGRKDYPRAGKEDRRAENA